jgi:predicted RNase H-like nuclease (RuvC/YqgF family)
MDETFELLEEKVRRAAELVKALRKENKGLQDDLSRSRARLQDAEKRLDALEKEASSSAGRSQELEALAKDVKTLRQEREEVRRRIAKLVEVLEGLD